VAYGVNITMKHVRFKVLTATSMNRSPDPRLPPNADSARLIYICCYQSRRCQNLISEFPHRTNTHSSSETWRTLAITLGVDCGIPSALWLTWPRHTAEFFFSLYDIPHRSLHDNTKTAAGYIIYNFSLCINTRYVQKVRSDRAYRPHRWREVGAPALWCLRSRKVTSDTLSVLIFCL
jgi:hypothetical protein